MKHESDTTVTELVQIPLKVSFEEFLAQHNSTFLPTLLAQPGIISVRTGTELIVLAFTFSAKQCPTRPI
jgi:hypothetical protein